MRPVFALALLGGLAACSGTNGLPTQTAYKVANMEQPQPVQFYCGKLVDVRPATLEFGYEAGVGITPTFQLAEVAVSRQMFQEILMLIARLRAPPAPA